MTLLNIKTNNKNFNNRNSLKGDKPFSFYENIEYFTNDYDGTLIYINNEQYLIKERSLFVMNYILELYLTNLKIYLQTVKKVLNYQYNNPIVLSESLIFVATKNIRNYDNIWINISNVKKFEYKNEKTIITFKSGNILKIDKNKKYIMKQLHKIELLKTYLLKIRYL